MIPEGKCASPQGVVRREVAVSSTDKNPSGSSLPPDPMIGRTFAGKYKIQKKLGEGGMGSVYSANQEPIDRLVAIKVLLGRLAEDDVAVKRFEQEARAVSKMQHPNTVTIYDYGKSEDGRLYIVMEHLKGRTLSDLLRKEGNLDALRAIRLVRQVCASLHDAHAAGIIHRDLKPDNIFLTEVGADKEWVKVLDFGVAKLANENAATLTQTGMIFGTPKYMSPEQAEGRQLDYRADIYALGVVMFEILVGRPPFLADTPVALLLKHIQSPIPPFKQMRPDLEIPAELEAVVHKMLAKLPEDRHADVTVLANELDRVLAGAFAGATASVSVNNTPGRLADRPTPTEVVPVGGDPATGGPLPPHAVPSGLSLGVSPGSGAGDAQRTRPSSFVQEFATEQGTPISRLPTEPAPPDLSAELSFGSSTTPGGITRPVVGPGPHVDTLGSMEALPRPKQSPWLLIGGVSSLVAAAGLVAAIALSDRGVQSSPLPVVEPIAAPDPSPVTAREPEPEPEVKPPEPEPDRPTATRPTPARPTPVERPVVARPAPEPAKPKPAERVTMRFESSPPGAIVELAEQQVGITPFVREFAKGDDIVLFVFKKDGFVEARESATLARDRSFKPKLEKRAVAARPEPAPVTPKPVPAKEKAKPDPSVLNDRVDDLKDIY